MKTIVLEKPNLFRLTDTPYPPKPGPGEALVRVHRVGVCGSDLHAIEGKQAFFTYLRVIGHEVGVEVVALGVASDDAGMAVDVVVGDRCCVEPCLSCGHCSACRRGKTNCCANVKVLGVHVDGGMREAMLVPTRNLHRSETLSFDELALVEMLAIGAHAMRRATPENGENVLVIGAGPIGLSVTESALAAGANVLVMDVRESRLAFCRENVAVTACLDARDDPMAQIRELLSGELPTLVVDATGNPKSMNRSFDYVEHGGRLLFVGHYTGDITFSNPLFYAREMTLTASRNATAEDFSRAMHMLDTGQINADAWITHRASADEFIEAVNKWMLPDSGVLKAVLEM